MKRLGRRGLLAASALLVTGAAHGTTSALAQSSAISKPVKAQPARKPRNVVFILLDDLRYDGMGFLQPELKTPNIDRLARGGTYFPNTVVTSSLCSPSRATILTGETARNHGVVDNANSSEAGLTFFPAYLQKAGYQTAFIGKWHMGNDVDSPRPGFDKWVSFRGQGSYYPSSGDPDAAIQGGETTMWNVDGKKVAQQGYITDELTDYAMTWLQKERDPSKPFFLYLSHKAVHSDPLPPPRYRHLYDKTDFKIPASAANTLENYRGKPMWVYNQRNTWHGIDFFYNSDMKMAEYLRFYYGALAAVDDSVGCILDYLKKSGLEKDTLVVFTADNGFQIGDHGLIDKRTAYQASVRVPMLMYEPGTVPAGAINNGRIRNLDYAPTFLDLAGVERPPQFEGVSAWPLITGKVADGDWKAPDFTYEYYWEWAYPMTPGTFAIQRGDLKYIQYYGVYDTDELYDLSRDPDEMRNLIDDPAYLSAKVELRKVLYQQLANRDGRHAIPFGERNAIGSVRRNRAGPGAAPFPNSWLVEPNRLDRKDNVLPDSLEKQRAHDMGKAFMPFPVLGSSEADTNAGLKH
ncbi:sulfatase family protein [Sphingobium ummariense]|nr:sulfatase [Sphingobium ummariense]